MASFSATNNILQIVLPYHRGFHKRLCGKVLRANGGIDPK